MDRTVIAASFLVVCALSGCATTADPKAPEAVTPAPVDASAESEYLEQTYETLPDNYKSDENEHHALTFGYGLCENAAANGTTTGAEAQAHIDELNEQDQSYVVRMSLALLQGKFAGELLCPEFAGE